MSFVQTKPIAIDGHKGDGEEFFPHYTVPHRVIPLAPAS
jgi:hypothetical protein